MITLRERLEARRYMRTVGSRYTKKQRHLIRLLCLAAAVVESVGFFLIFGNGFGAIAVLTISFCIFVNLAYKKVYYDE